MSDQLQDQTDTSHSLPLPSSTSRTTESPAEHPEVSHSESPSKLRRWSLTTVLFLVGGTLLVTPLPNVGRIVDILWENPLFLILFGGWYIGRAGLATLAHGLYRHRHKLSEDGSAIGKAVATPSVSILIPAYNEGRDIGETVASIKRLNYDGDIEIVIVDDGSCDGTWYVLQALADAYDNLRVFTQDNAGSAAARNAALEYARNEVVVSLDADTVLHEDAITQIARHFTSEDIVAVGGNVNVENMDSGGWWAKMQTFDYALAMELGRMFQSMLGFVLCLSGAFGAFRRETLLKAGGWNEHWLYSDDFEVSIRMHEHGEIKYTPAAQADTIVPTTVRGWFHQRKAWAQRGVSVMLLHYKKQFNISEGMIGIVGLPLRAILTALIIVEFAGFFVAILFGGADAAQSIAWVLAVGLVSMTGLCALMLGVLTLLLVDEKPIQYAPWAIGYLLVYRPLHAYVRIYGFSQALWWELSSFGGSLRSDPKSNLPALTDGGERNMEGD